MTKEEVKREIAKWQADEYDTPIEEFDESEDVIAIAYTEYEGRGDGLFVTEQWYIDLDGKVFYCELNGEREPELDKRFDTYEVALMCLDFNWLIGEADFFIEEHLDKFEQ